MFRTIQVLLIAAIAIAMILLFRRKLHKEKSLIAGLLLCLLLAAVVSNGIVELIPLPTDPVIVTATGEKNEAASGNEAYLINYIVGGTEYEIQNATEGKWFWKGDAYMWRNENDPRQPDGTTRSITMQIPYGQDRSIQFGLSEWNGIVEVTYGGETQAYDLFKSGDKNSLYVPVPDTEAFALYSTKLLRLAAFLLITAAIMACPVFCAMKYDDTAIKNFWAKHWDKLYYAAIGLLHILVLFYVSKSSSLWYDEIWNLGWIYENYTSKIIIAIQEFWFKITPYGDEYLLLLMQIMVGISIYISGLIGREFGGKKLGIILSTLLATSTVVAAQCSLEFRTYAYTLLTTSIVIYLYIKKQKSLGNEKISLMLLYSFFIALMMTAIEFCIVVAGFLLLSDLFLFLSKKTKEKALLAFIFPIIYGIYWIFTQFSIERFNEITWESTPPFSRIPKTFIWLCDNENWIAFMALLGFLVILVSCFYKIRKKETIDFQIEYAYLALAFIAISMGTCAFIYSKILNPDHSLWVNRYFISIILNIMIFAAKGIEFTFDTIFSKNKKYFPACLIATCLILCIKSFPFYTYKIDIHYNKGYENAANTVQSMNDYYLDSTIVLIDGNDHVNDGITYYLTHKGLRDDIRHETIYNAPEYLIDYTTIYIFDVHRGINSRKLSEFLSENYEQMDTYASGQLLKFVKKT